LEFIANASYEMGRILKPGGILTLSTEFKLPGSPEGDGWDTATYILSEERIMKYIVEASGLELVDDFNSQISPKTMRSKQKLSTFLEDYHGNYDRFIELGSYPHIILTHEGYIFCSVHLALMKTSKYPAINNYWAKPSENTFLSVNDLKKQAISHLLNNRNK